MIKRFFKRIFKIIITILLIGIITGGLDYLRMTSGDIPIFNVNSYDSQKRIQTYNGMLYKATRKVRASINEPLVDSNSMKFYILYKYSIKIPKQYKEIEMDYTIETKEIKDCKEQAKLYYADLEHKVYTYCLDTIKIKEEKVTELSDFLKSDKTFIEDISAKLGYSGIYTDNTTLMFESLNDDYTNNGLSMYRCNKENITDIYIGPKNMTFQNDFCTYKNDDIKFIFEIEEEKHENVTVVDENTQTEVLFEDETYRYELEEGKSDYIFITTPEVRGKQATRTNIKDILQNGTLTIDDLIEKGLVVNKIDKRK